jgi:5-methylthioadenosine/S-adenosylhomocysteine deaminase
LLYSASAADVDTVLVAGRVLLRGGKLQTVDRRRVLREVNRRVGRLAGRRNGRIAHYPTASRV